MAIVRMVFYFVTISNGFCLSSIADNFQYRILPDFRPFDFFELFMGHGIR